MLEAEKKKHDQAKPSSSKVPYVVFDKEEPMGRRKKDQGPQGLDAD